MTPWDTIKNNQTVVDLNAVSVPAERVGKWTGRVMYGLNYIDDDEGEVSFVCGPQTNGRGLEDTLDGGVYEKLQSLFADMDIEVGAAENAHDVTVPDGVKAKEVWKVIKDRLTRSGAIKQ